MVITLPKVSHKEYIKIFYFGGFLHICILTWLFSTRCTQDKFLWRSWFLRISIWHKRECAVQFPIIWKNNRQNFPMVLGDGGMSVARKKSQGAFWLNGCAHCENLSSYTLRFLCFSVCMLYLNKKSFKGGVCDSNGYILKIGTRKEKLKKVFSLKGR